MLCCNIFAFLKLEFFRHLKIEESIILVNEHIKAYHYTIKKLCFYFDMAFALIVTAKTIRFFNDDIFADNLLF